MYLFNFLYSIFYNSSLTGQNDQQCCLVFCETCAYSSIKPVTKQQLQLILLMLQWLWQTVRVLCTHFTLPDCCFDLNRSYWPRGIWANWSQADQTPPVDVSCSCDRLEGKQRAENEDGVDKETAERGIKKTALKESKICLKTEIRSHAPLKLWFQDDVHQLSDSFQHLDCGVSNLSTQTHPWNTERTETLWQADLNLFHIWL